MSARERLPTGAPARASRFRAARTATARPSPVDVIRKALLRDSQRKAGSPLGAALDPIAEQKGG